MYKSYYYLNRLTLELNSILVGKRIISIFSQEKDRLIIQLDGQEELFIEISVNHSDPFINIRNKFSRAKKNTVEFFTELFNNTIKDVLIASDDRIIKIVTDSSDLIFAIRGKYTNIFCNSDTLKSFKNEDEENLLKFRNEFETKDFSKRLNIPDSKLINGKSIKEIRNEYRFIGREIENEVNARKRDTKEDSELLLNLLQNILTKDPAVYTVEKSSEIHIGFDSLRILRIISILSKGLSDSLIFPPILSKI